MTFNISDWKRFEWEGTPIYFNSKEPDWFVPNRSGDRILRDMAEGKSIGDDFITRKFVKRLPQPLDIPYTGRGDYLAHGTLKEIWFHLTNRCNLSCTHCLFASSPSTVGELSAEKVLHIAEEAHGMGCRVFGLTGGEPFLHDEIIPIIEGLLQHRGCHVAVLTNGMNLKKKLASIYLDPARVHLQISVDGLDEKHDAVRGKGTFKKLNENLEWLSSNGIPFTISMSVTRENLSEMPAMIDFAASAGAANFHFMWYFIRGRGKAEWFAPGDDIFPGLVNAAEAARKAGISIDNIEALKSRIFVPRGTIHDGTTSGWESVAVGPDERVYPSPALVGVTELASEMSEGLQKCHKNSNVLKEIRNTTVARLDSDLRFFTGGGDMDHSYVNSRTFMGNDPYDELYRRIMLLLIAREAPCQSDDTGPAMVMRMGELLESCGAHGRVALNHSNCLLGAAGDNSLTAIKSFYTEAAGKKNPDIINPVSYGDDSMTHIPEEYRFRGYGCGSPVMDADIKNGESVLDLGCGSGVECFIAAKITGSSGTVTGVDMLDPMLDKAEKGRIEVEKNLGYKNIIFKKGYLEDLPVNDSTIDVVISNCVMNLSVNKRKAYAEILRVLKPGGRIVISDVVTETDPDPVIRNDEGLRGECIAGALTQLNLVALLDETGFELVMFQKRFPYRMVMGHQFYSLTYSAFKPDVRGKNIRAIYRGPASGIILKDGTSILVGEVFELTDLMAEGLGDNLFLTDESGNITNIDADKCCDCCSTPEDKLPVLTGILHEVQPSIQEHSVGCMVCGEPLVYFKEEKVHECSYCGDSFSVNALCEKGHFVCDACHGRECMGSECPMF